MAVASLTHVVFIAGLGWTRVRAGVKFSVRLAEKFPDVFISIYVFAPFGDQATQSEIACEQTRIAPSIVDTPVSLPLGVVYSLEKSLKPWISKELKSTSSKVGEQILDLPSWILEDHINGGVGLGYGLPVVSFWAAPAAVMIAHFRNVDHGSGGRLLDAIRARLDRETWAKESLEELFYQGLSRRVVCVPGLPPYYEHQQIPQLLPPVLDLVAVLQKR
ncbi:glycosyltransferase family 1 protein [Ceratobasidium sp. AG-Ba]|nr:glycosyltransferase family 1 protein [Ceratobasidium sp. AG-Ba]QRW10576.1 glycosyltransferase family 1 protein [Ceratobasidium sp. AG-Ba]